MDEVIKSRFVYQPHENRLYHEQTQPTEDDILSFNQEARKDNLFNDLSFGRQVACIPFIMWNKAIRDGYDLACPDSKIAEKELFRYLQSDEGKVCMVRNKL